MAISADETGFYIVEETTVGVIPATPAWQPLPIVSESLATNAATTVSNTLNPQRQTVDSILTGLDVSGSVECELARTPAMDLIFESAFASTWDTATAPPAWSLSVEGTKLTFSVMKRWPDGAGGFIYQLYSGCMVNTMAFTMSAGAEVTVSIGIVGQSVDADRATVEPVGSTYLTLSEFNVLRAPEVTDILLDNAGGTLAPELAGQCTTDMVLNMNANVRGVQCLGTLGNKDVVLGRFEGSLDMTIFFNDNNIMEEFLNQAELSASFTIGDDTTTDFYKFSVPRGKISSETVVAGGTGTDVVNQLTLQALLDASLTPQTSITSATTAYV